VTQAVPPTVSPSYVATTPTLVANASIVASTAAQQTGVVAGCQVFHTVEFGETFYNIQRIYDITFDEFYQWNPSGKVLGVYTYNIADAMTVGANCENLWLGYAYCVRCPASTAVTTMV
jgi:hypothetical protein